MKADPKHLKILRRGVKAWNEWRAKNPQIKPELSGADLRAFDDKGITISADLKNIDLKGANLSEAQLFSCDFTDAALCEADLRNARLSNAILNGANLAKAKLYNSEFSFARLHKVKFNDAVIRYSDFTGAQLVDADLSGADLTGTQLKAANLRQALLIKTILEGVNLYGADLSGANLENATVGWIVFAKTNLTAARGLDSVKHVGPSSISIDTIYISQGGIADQFLRNAGVPEEVILNLLPAIRIGSPIQWHSCFISYNTKNQDFAERLHSRMQQAGLRVWFDREDMKGGDYLHTQIDSAIQLHDRLLLVLSEESIQSKWVEREIRRTRKIERTEKRRKLFPIRLMDMKTLREWECLDSDTGEDLAEEVRKYHIPDFSNWKNHDAFEAAFARLEKDLRTSIGK